jgi:hypothetical protein
MRLRERSISFSWTFEKDRLAGLATYVEAASVIQDELIALPVVPILAAGEGDHTHQPKAVDAI